jgi:Protein of unknown function (DUF2894)
MAPNGATVWIAALRERGAHRADPVRFAYIEALARRSAGQAPSVQTVLAPRLAEALHDYQQRHGSAGPTAAPAPTAPVARPSPLASLLQRLESTGPGASADADNSAAGPEPATPGLPARAELRSLRQSRSAWKRLHLERQIAQALAQLPDNPGPLNSQLLLLRTLQRLQTLAPAYLESLITQLETLQWLAERQPERQPPASAGVRASKRPTEGGVKRPAATPPA